MRTACYNPGSENPARRDGGDKDCSPERESRSPVEAAFPARRSNRPRRNNLLSYPGVEDLLLEMICRRYAVNFNQTLDVTYLNESNYGLLRRIDYRNARFDKPMIYFSLNYPKMIEHFRARRHMLEGFGQDCVTVVC